MDLFELEEIAEKAAEGLTDVDSVDFKKWRIYDALKVVFYAMGGGTIEPLISNTDALELAKQNVELKAKVDQLSAEWQADIAINPEAYDDFCRVKNAGNLEALGIDTFQSFKLLWEETPESERASIGLEGQDDG